MSDTSILTPYGEIKRPILCRISARLLTATILLSLPVLATAADYDLLKLNVETTVPSKGVSICRLNFLDGLQGSGQPLSNRLTVNGAGLTPGLNGTDILRCSDAEDPDTLLVGHWKMDEKGGSNATGQTRPTVGTNADLKKPLRRR